MQVGSRGIEASLDADRPALLGRCGQAFAQVLFANELGQPLLQIGKLLLDGGKAHGSHCREWVDRPPVESGPIEPGTEQNSQRNSPVTMQPCATVTCQQAQSRNEVG